MNGQQRLAVDAPNGYVQIIAGPGTGKTFTVVNRVCELLQRGIDPGKLIVMTFTRAAAQEIRERVQSKLKQSESARKVVMGTFHSVAARFLRNVTNFKGVISEHEKRIILNMLASEFQWDVNPPEFAKGRSIISYLDKFVSRVQQRIDKEEAYSTMDPKLVKFSEAYQQQLKQLGSVDYDGLLVMFYELLANPETGGEIQDKVEAVLIDEFQDTSVLQLELSLLLSQKCQNLTVVGDPDQSIYGFRNANPYNFQRMFDRVGEGNCHTYYLESNYRSEQPILNAAANVINLRQRYGGERGPLTAAARTHQTPVQLLKLFSNSVSECAQLVAKNVESILKTGVKPEEVCVLVRNSTMFGIYDAAFLSRGITARFVGGKRLTADPKYEAIAVLLRVCLDETDSLAILQSFDYVNPRVRSQRFRELHNLTLPSLRNSQVCVKYVDTIEEFKSHLKKVLKEARESNKTSEQAAVHATLEMISVIAGYRKLENTELLQETIVQFASVYFESLEDVDTDPESFMREYVKLWALDSTRDPNENKSTITVSTVHSAKGLEWPVVFVCEYRDAILDFKDEEIRLMYVAVTRAQSLLVIPLVPGVLSETIAPNLVEGDVKIDVDALGECVQRKLVIPKAEAPKRTTNLGNIQLIEGFQFGDSSEFKSSRPGGVSKQLSTSSTSSPSASRSNSVRSTSSDRKKKKAAVNNKVITSFFKPKK